ncbi:MAG: hypothetical protein U0936_28145 [Planctomycetaceae bacterium]
MALTIKDCRLVNCVPIRQVIPQYFYEVLFVDFSTISEWTILSDERNFAARQVCSLANAR